MIELVQAPPFATIQDLGRPGRRAAGVPPSGALDPAVLTLTNLLVGNVRGAAAIEWALGPGALSVTAPLAIAVAGAAVTVDGVELPEWTALPVGPGSVVELGLPSKRFAWLAVSGGVAVPEVLGSRSTYLPGGFGGLHGRLLRRGDQLNLGAPLELLSGPRTLPEEFLPRSGMQVRLVPGPQGDLFDDASWSALLSASYRIAAASDRMGSRLDGPALRHRAAAALPSEPVCPGAIQVPDGGAPIVLLPDGPTVGGYPKMAVVISADLGRLSQHAPGSRPDFALITFEEAVAERRSEAARLRDAARALRSAGAEPSTGNDA